MYENPFVGLRAFGYEQRDRFFGRERQSYALYRLTAFGFIAVVGNSGSGKSSLVRAGLLPLLLDAQGQQPWQIAVMTPGGAPLERLTGALATLAPENEDNDAHAVRFERIRYLLERSSNGIADALDEMPDLADTSVLLVVDQFEELFRIDAESREETAAFVALLLQLHQRRPSAHVLITMRSDFIGDCARFSGLPEAVGEAQYLVPSLSRQQRATAIVKPIARANATIDPTLVERLINAVGYESDQLPVLQHALARMWIAARERIARSATANIELTEEDYRSIGTLDGALSQHAEAIMAELSGREAVVEAIFRALSERDTEGRATRRVLTLRQLVAETGMLEDDVIAVVDRFRAADCGFLLPAGGGLTPETRIDVVHEALLRRWERLTPSDPKAHGWLDREAEDGEYYRSLLARIDGGETTLQLGSVIERYAWWTSVPHTAAWAMRYGGRHDRVEQFFAASLAALAESEAAVARAKAEEIERGERRKRTARRILVASLSASAIMFALLIVTFFALLGSQRTTNASLVTQSKLVARDAESLADRGDPTDAALLALEMLPQHLSDPDRPFTWSAYGALTDSLANIREIRDYKLVGPIGKIEYSPDGSHFIAHQEDGTIWIWKIGAAHPEHLLRAQSFARDVEFSPDGSLIASGSNDGSVRLWNARSGNLIWVIRGYRTQVQRTVFSQDGRRLLTSADTGGVTRLYDVASGRLVREVRGGVIAYLSPTLGTFGNRVITVDGAGAVTVWDDSLTKRLHVISAAASTTVDATLSSDANLVAVAYADNSVDTYDANNGRRLAHIVSSDGPIVLLRLSRDGKFVVVTYSTFSRVCDTSTGAIIETIPSISGDSDGPKFSRDGRQLLLPDNAGSVGVYSRTYGAWLVRVTGDSAEYNDGDFSPDGKRVLTASNVDEIVRESDISTGTSSILDETFPTDSGGDDGANIAIGPKGDVFAVADRHAIHIYDARSGMELRTLPQRNTVQYGMTETAFSPDGSVLLENSKDRVVGRWQWQGRKRLAPFIDDPSDMTLGHYRLRFAPDGQTIASLGYNTVRIQDAKTGSTRLQFSANHYAINALAMSPDSRRLVTGGNDGWIRVYDARSGRHILAFRAHRNWVRFVRFSPDGRLIASASSDESVRVWDAASGAQVAELDTIGAANSVAFSSDGRHILIGADDGARVWDYTTDRIVFALRGFEGPIQEADFVLRDTRIVTVGTDTTVRLWTVPKVPVCQQAIDEARARVTHELSPATRKAEFITPRHSPSILNAFLPSQACS